MSGRYVISFLPDLLSQRLFPLLELLLPSLGPGLCFPLIASGRLYFSSHPKRQLSQLSALLSQRVQLSVRGWLEPYSHPKRVLLRGKRAFDFFAASTGSVGMPDIGITWQKPDCIFLNALGSIHIYGSTAEHVRIQLGRKSPLVAPRTSAYAAYS